MAADSIAYLGPGLGFVVMTVLFWLFFAVNNALASDARLATAHIVIGSSILGFTEGSAVFAMFHATRNLPFLLVLFWLLRKIGRAHFD